MPSAATLERAVSTSTTSLKPERSTRGRACASRSRNRLEVFFASPIPFGPPAASSARSRASLLSWLLTGVEEGAGHRVVLADGALAHDDLEQVGLTHGRAEHLGAGPEIRPPDTAELLVELAGVEPLHPFPVLVEAPRPVVERERVVAPQVLDVDNLQAAALAPVDRLGEAGNPAAREDVLADPELGVTHADVADEMDHAQTPGLEVVGVGLDHLAELVASCMLERADRQQLVELARHLAEVALEDLDLALEAAALDLGARLLDLLGGGVDAGAERPVSVPGEEQQVAPAAADVGEGLALLQQYLAADVVHFRELRFLERLRAVGEPGAGVGHAHFVEPLAVEVLSGAVVKARVELRLTDRSIAVAEFMPPVAHLDEEGRFAVEPGVHAGAEGVRDAALDVDVPVEIRLEEADVSEKQHPERGAALADEDGDVGCAFVILPRRAVGEDHAKADFGLRADLLHGLPELRAHIPSGR